MAENENRPDTHVYQTEHEVLALRDLVKDARNSTSLDGRLTALVGVVEALIGQLGKQARLIEDLRSDMTHKQGIVSNIAGGTFGS